MYEAQNLEFKENVILQLTFFTTIKKKLRILTFKLNKCKNFDI